MKRKLYLDVIKIIGAFAIILLHTLSNTVHPAAPFISEKQQLVVHSIHQLLYVAVPLFMMATGAGFLARKEYCGYSHMKAHIVKILCCIVLFGSLFWTIECVLTGNSWNIKGLCLALLTDSTWSHMWYLYSILGVYLIMPLLSAFMRNTKPGEQLVLVGIIFFLGCLFPYIGGKIGFVPVAVLPIKGIWIFYVLAGGILADIEVEQLRKKRWIVGIGSIVMAVLVLGKGAQGSHNILLEDYPGTLLLAVCLFCSMRAFGEGVETPKVLVSLVQATLGIYILHPVYIHFFVKIMNWNPQYKMPIMEIPLMALLVAILSYFTVTVARRIPIIRKYLL